MDPIITSPPEFDTVKLPEDAYEKALGNLPFPGITMKSINLPSGMSVIIREQNGEDDAVISNLAMQADASAINSFIQGLIVWYPNASGKNNLPTVEDILLMPLRDKYALMVKSRIFSIGNILEFDYTWDASIGLKGFYDQNLNDFVWDYGKEFPEDATHEDYNKERIPPYKLSPLDDGYIYFDTTGHIFTDKTQVTAPDKGKALRFKLLDGYGEKFLLGLGEMRTNVNSKYIARNLSLLKNGVWYPVENFREFNPKDMQILRRMVMDSDVEYDGLTQVDHPTKSDIITNIPLLTIPNFFFPVGI